MHPQDSGGYVYEPIAELYDEVYAERSASRRDVQFFVDEPVLTRAAPSPKVVPAPAL